MTWQFTMNLNFLYLTNYHLKWKKCLKDVSKKKITKAVVRSDFGNFAFLNVSCSTDFSSKSTLCSSLCCVIKNTNLFFSNKKIYDVYLSETNSFRATTRLKELVTIIGINCVCSGTRLQIKKWNLRKKKRIEKKRNK